MSLAITIRCMFLGLMSAATTWAQVAPVLVAVDEGARLRPLARFDGTRWTETCELPAQRKFAGSPAPRLFATGGVVVDSVRRVRSDQSEWRQLEGVVKALFEARARRERLSAAALARVPLIVDAIFASSATSPSQVYFFTASKTVPDTREDVDADDDGEVDPRGDLRIEVTGWLGREREVISLGTSAALSWEQVKDRSFDSPRRAQDTSGGSGTRRTQVIPIGMLRMAGVNVWVLQDRSGSSIRYALYQIDTVNRAVRLLTRPDPLRC